MVDINQLRWHPNVLSAIACHRNIEIVRPCVVIFDNLLRSILVADGQFMINCFIAQIIDVRLDGKRANLERRVIGAEFLCIDVRSNIELGCLRLKPPRTLTFTLGPVDIPGDSMLQISLAIHSGKVHRAINDSIA